MEKSYKELLHDITTFIFDVDGVLTDGKLHITTDGQMHRTMNAKDGFAMKEAIKKGYNLCIITGGTDDGVRTRLLGLGIQDVVLGAQEKLEHLETYMEKRAIQPQNILYMGDDIPDYPVMEKVGLPACPQDAVKEIKEVSKYVSHKNGGQGCVRDVIEQVLKVQRRWIHD